MVDTVSHARFLLWVNSKARKEHLSPTYLLNGSIFFRFFCVWSLKVVIVARFQSASGISNFIILRGSYQTCYWYISALIFGPVAVESSYRFCYELNATFNKKQDNICIGLSFIMITWYKNRTSKTHDSGPSWNPNEGLRLSDCCS